MPALATVDDIEAVRNRALTAEDEDFIGRQIELAGARVRAYTRQQLDVVEDDEIVLVGNWSSSLLLPERPVTAVSLVTVNGVELVGDVDFTFTWNGLDRRYGSWGGPLARVAVTYTHGYAAGTWERDLIASTVAAMVHAAAVNPDGLQGESLDGSGGYAYTNAAGGSSGIMLSDAQKADLKQFRVLSGNAPILSGYAPILSGSGDYVL